MAFGAGSKSLVQLVVTHGMVLAVSGVVLGLAASLFLTRAASSLLYGITAFDPLTFAGISLLLAGVSLVASYIPARRAARIDPVVALRGGSR
jgi:putative ABC transport system permease protein